MPYLLNQDSIYHKNYTSLEVKAKAVNQEKVYFVIFKVLSIIYLGKKSFAY